MDTEEATVKGGSGTWVDITGGKGVVDIPDEWCDGSASSGG